MGIRQGRCHEEPKVFTVRQGFFADFNYEALALFCLLLQEDRLKRRINLSADVLKQNPLSELDTHFNASH